MAKNILRFECGHEGCTEIVRYESDNNGHASDLRSRYGNGKYRCSRHAQPDSVLGPSRTTISHEMKVFSETHGRYWGVERAFSGFTSGPGFKAFACDFPEGTVLRVTAEIILPAAPDEPAVRPVVPLID